jgi:hypothetical protein
MVMVKFGQMCSYGGYHVTFNVMFHIVTVGHFVVIDHEILSMVIRKVPLLWHIKKLRVNCLTACPGTV